MFADDIKLVYTFEPTDVNTAINDITDDLHSLTSWCRNWSMTISAAKSVVLTYKCQLPDGSLTIDNLPLNCKPIVRDLGVSYSPTFNFSEHATFQVARARRCTGLVFRSFRLRDSILHVYKSHVRPLLEYCPIVFSNMRKTDRILFENVQRRFTKQLVGFSSSLNYQERCILLKLEPLWLRRIKLNLCFFHNILHERSFSSTRMLNFALETPYFLRNRPNTLATTRTKTSLRANFFLCKYSHLWNNLPLHIRSILSADSFRLAVNKFLTVEKTLLLTSTGLSPMQAFEQGVGF